MIPIKIQCGCGQKYGFDVEPVQGRLPSPVACPSCGADGTTAANEIIAQSAPLAAAAAPAQPASTAERFTAALNRASGESEAEKWKWWYFVLAGVCIGGYSIWQAYDQHRVKPLGELFLAFFCIVIGIWGFQHKRKKKQMGG